MHTIYLHLSGFILQFLSGITNIILLINCSHLFVAQGSSSLIRHTYPYATPTFITEALCPVTYVQLFKMIVKVNSLLIQHQLTLIRLVSMTCFNCKATLTIDINYSCHIKALELDYQSFGVDIMPLVRADTHTKSHIHRHLQ